MPQLCLHPRCTQGLQLDAGHWPTGRTCGRSSPCGAAACAPPGQQFSASVAPLQEGGRRGAGPRCMSAQLASTAAWKRLQRSVPAPLLLANEVDDPCRPRHNNNRGQRAGPPTTLRRQPRQAVSAQTRATRQMPPVPSSQQPTRACQAGRGRQAARRAAQGHRQPQTEGRAPAVRCHALAHAACVVLRQTLEHKAAAAALTLYLGGPRVSREPLKLAHHLSQPQRPALRSAHQVRAEELRWEPGGVGWVAGVESSPAGQRGRKGWQAAAMLRLIKDPPGVLQG